MISGTPSPLLCLCEYAEEMVTHLEKLAFTKEGTLSSWLLLCSYHKANYSSSCFDCLRRHQSQPRKEKEISGVLLVLSQCDMNGNIKNVCYVQAQRGVTLKVGGILCPQKSLEAGKCMCIKYLLPLSLFLSFFAVIEGYDQGNLEKGLFCTWALTDGSPWWRTWQRAAGMVAGTGY